MNFESLLNLIQQPQVQMVVISGTVILGAIIVGLLVSFIIRFIMNKWRKSEEVQKKVILLDSSIWQVPLNLLLPALCIAMVFPVLQFPGKTGLVVRHILSIWIIFVVTYISIRLVTVLKDFILSNYDLTKKDNLRARKAVTQFRVIERIMIFSIMVISFSSILMTFERVRQIGLSLITSAGIVGVVLGFAAQKSISTMIAGIQIAITQPIRIEDVVIVEGEWGWIEEITLTYVVVRIWDQRRLIVPINYFIERSFQNWTRTSAEILGTVYIYADYTIPIEALRKELKAILEEHPHWDRRVCVLQVTNTTEKAMEIRALMSTEDSSKGWELRCHVREGLIKFIQEKYPESLPKVRIETLDNHKKVGI